VLKIVKSDIMVTKSKESVLNVQATVPIVFTFVMPLTPIVSYTVLNVTIQNILTSITIVLLNVHLVPITLILHIEPVNTVLNHVTPVIMNIVVLLVLTTTYLKMIVNVMMNVQLVTMLMQPP